jgi:anti-sigma regulatory factor (Ser/Thr protein kinase)
MIAIEIGIGKRELSLSVPAETDSLPLVRQAFRGFVQATEISDEIAPDAELGLTEAASNVIKHAYEDEGAMDLHFCLDSDRLVIRVRDAGVGIPEGILSGAQQGDGFGLVLMDGVSSELGIESSSDGTEVILSFDLATPDPGGSFPPEGVLRRVLAVLGAQADLSYDRLTEATLAGELLARHSVAYLAGDVLRVFARPTPEALEVRAGPYEPDGAGTVLAQTETPVVGRVLEKLAEVGELRDERGEWLELTVDARAGRSG